MTAIKILYLNDIHNILIIFVLLEFLNENIYDNMFNIFKKTSSNCITMVVISDFKLADFFLIKKTTQTVKYKVSS